ncbi:hypothetical protein STHAL_22830 [Streptomyces halstedii]|uniref:Uncharacterized protein n=1 Tax=Streptomyces halstedii TaxID=1944 RepID=A0ABS6TVH6_STRHA|nr:hypothetical protein [Streptomyces halstedii]MBV7672286.1 hypothetical protein [Streptomyces halstedii]
MLDPSDSLETSECEVNGRSDTAESSGAADPAPESGSDLTAASTVLAEVLPGIAVVCGEVPAELRPGLIDFRLVPAADREQVSAVLASIANADPGSTASCEGSGQEWPGAMYPSGTDP